MRSHPQADVTSVGEATGEAFDRLAVVAAARPRTQVVDAAGGAEEAYRSLYRLLA